MHVYWPPTGHQPLVTSSDLEEACSDLPVKGYTFQQRRQQISDYMHDWSFSLHHLLVSSSCPFPFCSFKRHSLSTLSFVLNTIGDKERTQSLQRETVDYKCWPRSISGIRETVPLHALYAYTDVCPSVLMLFITSWEGQQCLLSFIKKDFYDFHIYIWLLCQRVKYRTTITTIKIKCSLERKAAERSPFPGLPELLTREPTCQAICVFTPDAFLNLHNLISAIF